ncbi:MAG: hypothetical protein BWY25_02250 [Chloroflexi bacterium ADurb.Bin222]|nr:MAG: hypothetical protein BWY25_02250 [Chloroflexi bacterium ADurb.Bin222]
MKHAAQIQVALRQVLGEVQRTADGVSRFVVVQHGECGEHEHHGEIGRRELEELGQPFA